MSRTIREIIEKLEKGALSAKLYSVAVLRCCSHAVRAKSFRNSDAGV